MQTKTIGLVIVIAAILYIMYHHNNIAANLSGTSSGGGFLGGLLSNPLGVGGGGGGTTLGGIGHNYANDPATCVTCAGAGSPIITPPRGGSPSAPIRIGEPPILSQPITYTPPVAVASQPPASSGWVTTAPGSTYQSGVTVPVTSLQGLSYSQLFGLRRA